MIYAAINNDKQTFSYLFRLEKVDNEYCWVNQFYANNRIPPKGQYFRLIEREAKIKKIKGDNVYICDFHEDDLNLPLILGDGRAIYKYFWQ